MQQYREQYRGEVVPTGRYSDDSYGYGGDRQSAYGRSRQRGREWGEYRDSMYEPRRRGYDGYERAAWGNSYNRDSSRGRSWRGDMQRYSGGGRLPGPWNRDPTFRDRAYPTRYNGRGGGGPFRVRGRPFREYFDMFEWGRRPLTENMLYYLIADITLRAIAFIVFRDAADSYGWLALYIYLSGHAYVSRANIRDDFVAVTNALGSAVTGLFPLAGHSTARYAEAEVIYSTAFAVALALGGALLPGMPDPVISESYKTSIVFFVSAATFIKLYTFSMYVLPLTHGAKRPGDPGYLDELLR